MSLMARFAISCNAEAVRLLISDVGSPTRSVGSEKPVFIGNIKCIKIKKLNTHYYDGKLKENSLIESVSDLQKVDAPELTAEKRELFTSLMDKLMAEKQTMAGYAVRAIIDGIRSPANFDPTNGIYADDILYLICKGDYPSEYFTEQLGDIITSGSCPQGRCARLFQIL